MKIVPIGDLSPCPSRPGLHCGHETIVHQVMGMRPQKGYRCCHCGLRTYVESTQVRITVEGHGEFWTKQTESWQNPVGWEVEDE